MFVCWTNIAEAQQTAAIATAHPLATQAGHEILKQGGNAFDAGVAALLAGGVLEQDLYSLGGEALVLVYPKKEAKVTSIVGQGWAPHLVDVDWYLSRQKSLQGEGLDPAVVPGALTAGDLDLLASVYLRRPGGARLRVESPVTGVNQLADKDTVKAFTSRLPQEAAARMHAAPTASSPEDLAAWFRAALQPE